MEACTDIEPENLGNSENEIIANLKRIVAQVVSGREREEYVLSLNADDLQIKYIEPTEFSNMLDRLPRMMQ